MESNRRSSDPLVTVLAPAVDAVRRVLSQREPADVPHALGRVVQASGPRLPPPLWKKLVEHLEDDEQLRADALENLDRGDAATPVAKAFLARSPGWWRELAKAVDTLADARGDSRQDDLQRHLNEARDQLETTRRKVAEARDESSRLEEELKSVRGDVAARIEAHRRGDLDRVAALEHRVAELESEGGRQRSEITRLETELAGIRRRAGKPRPTPAAADADRLPGVGGDPMEIARSLDLGFRMLSRHRQAPADGAAGARAEGRLVPPGGLRSSDPAWFDWLTSVDVPLWLVVDGHNVVFTISGDRSQIADSMRRLEKALRRLRKRATAPLRVSVIYDSGLGGDRRAPHNVGGLDLRFAPQHSIADDEIVELVTGASVPVVVVTSDRELQARVGAAAEFVIDGIALARFAAG